MIEPTEPLPPLPGVSRALALGVALLVAKLALVALRAHDGLGASLATPWAPFALLHDDALLVLLFLVLELLARRAPPGRVLPVVSVAYLATVGWVAINVPIARLFSTPLTRAMTGAVGGAISDSILGQVTPGNVLAVLATVAAFALAWRLLPRVPRVRLYATATAVLALVVLLGGPALERVETAGVHRNAVVTLVRTTWQAVRRPDPPPPGWADAPLSPEGPALDLRHLAGAARAKPVVVVVLESHAARYLPAYGATRDATPNLSRLLERAVLFDAAYAAYPESIKGFFSYLCSTWPVAHTRATAYRHDLVPAHCLGDRFREAGYHTGLFHSGRFVYLDMSAIVHDRGFDVALDAGAIGGQFASSFGTDDASTARAVLDWIDDLPDEGAWLAVFMPIAGHHPYKAPGDAPRPFPETTEQEAYINDLHVGDQALGLLVDGLRERRLLDDVTWVVFGDHGEAFGEHEGNFAHSLFLYEENLHVPLAFVVPGALSRPVRAPQVASLVDVLPTLLDLADVPRTDRLQGRSLLAPDPGVAAFYTDHGVWQMGLRQDRWKLILDVEADRPRLFDLTTDPAERTDVAADHPERVQRYVDWLTGWHAWQHAHVRDYPSQDEASPAE